MISFNSATLTHTFPLGSNPLMDIEKLVFITKDESWFNRLSAGSISISFECHENGAISSSQLIFGSIISPYHKQPVLDVKRRYEFPKSLLTQCNNWVAKIAVNNLDFLEGETLNVFLLEQDRLNELIPEESLRLENIFIDLKNQRKTIREIVEALNLSEAIVLGWEKNFNEALNSIPKNLPIDVAIHGKDSEGKYIFAQSFSINLTALDKIKFDLSQYSTIDEEKLEKEKNREAFIILSKKAKEAFEIISKYVTEIVIKNTKDNTISFSYNVNTKDDNILKAINESLEFYFKTIYSIEKHAGQGQILTASNNNYFNAVNILPIALKSIAIRGYLGIKEIIISDLFTDSKWIFITGENGFGKTLLLQAITIGLNGTKDGDITLLEDTNSFINIEFKRHNDSFLNNIWSNHGFHKLEELACYGPARLQVASEESKNEIGRRSATTFSVFNPNGVLLDIELELFLNKHSNIEIFNYYCDIFKKIIPTIDQITINDLDRKLYYTEKDLETNTPFPYQVTFNQLASGIRSLIAMVGDMIIRLSASQPGIKDLSHLQGIVIIDEIDIHWHPKWQREIPKKLSEVFPNIQFIATTHSPLPLLGAPQNSIFLKVERTIEYGIQCRRVEIDIEKLLPNSIFTSPLFDMESITNVNLDKLSEVDTNDSYPDILKQRKIKKNIKKFESGAEDFPDELFKV